MARQFNGGEESLFRNDARDPHIVNKSSLKRNLQENDFCPVKFANGEKPSKTKVCSRGQREGFIADVPAKVPN